MKFICQIVDPEWDIEVDAYDASHAAEQAVASYDDGDEPSFKGLIVRVLDGQNWRTFRVEAEAVVDYHSWEIPDGEARSTP